MRLSQKTCASGYEGESPQTCTPWLAETRDGFVSVEVTCTAIPCTFGMSKLVANQCQSVWFSNGILILICVFERVLVYNQKKTTCLQSLASTFKTFSLRSSGLRKRTGLPKPKPIFFMSWSLGLVLGLWRSNEKKPWTIMPFMLPTTSQFQAVSGVTPSPWVAKAW